MFSFVFVFFLGVVWHFWIAPLLLVGGLLAFVAVLGGYLLKVVRPQFRPGNVPSPEAVPAEFESGQLDAGQLEAGQLEANQELTSATEG